ncbi:LysE family transporter [Gordonia sp. HY442]|uniref:LysE/ArgO family amino acid transporter n=1 Tax=Gordonia zhenghanii TaxID=2911516 RepID=UPI001F02B857|nr:LysE family transporter [Gordonia zhenghanii]MCF8604248.1 LysE family transporter [Gordonia zhenghanii]
MDVTTTLLLTAIAGLLTGTGLIIAIGPQNVFMLRQGISGSHVIPVVAVCVVSDIVLISAGTIGLGAAVSAHPTIITAAKIVGGAYLVVLGLIAARRAWKPRATSTTDDSGRNRGMWAALGTALALTWLNPHTYIDTVLTLGSIASSHADAKWAFTVGACVGSLVWFLALGLGARKVAPVFSSVRAWRILDAVIAVVMAALGISLVAMS